MKKTYLTIELNDFDSPYFGGVLNLFTSLRATSYSKEVAFEFMKLKSNINGVNLSLILIELNCDITLSKVILTETYQKLAPYNNAENYIFINADKTLINYYLNARCEILNESKFNERLTFINEYNNMKNEV